MDLDEFRRKPGMSAYDDLSDEALADGLYRKYYSDMPRNEFNDKIGRSQWNTGATPATGGTPMPRPRPEEAPQRPAPRAEGEGLIPLPDQVTYYGNQFGAGINKTVASGIEGASLLPGLSDETRQGLIKKADELRAETDKKYPVDKSKEGIGADIARGVGSTAAFATTGLVGAAGGVPGFLGAAAGTGISALATSGGEGSERARQFGATEEERLRAGRLGAVFAGPGDMADMMLGFLGTPGRAMGLIARVGKRAVMGAILEGGTEGLQELIQNSIEKGVYNPNKDITDNVGYSALVGALIGGPASAVIGGHESPVGLSGPDLERVRLLLQQGGGVTTQPPPGGATTTPPPPAPPPGGTTTTTPPPPLSPSAPVFPRGLPPQEPATEVFQSPNSLGITQTTVGEFPPLGPPPATLDDLLQNVTVPTATEGPYTPTVEPTIEGQITGKGALGNVGPMLTPEGVSSLKILPGTGGGLVPVLTGTIVPPKGAPMENPAGPSAASVVDSSQAMSNSGGVVVQPVDAGPQVTGAAATAGAVRAQTLVKPGVLTPHTMVLTPTPIIEQGVAPGINSLHTDTVGGLLSLLEQRHLPNVSDANNPYQAQIFKNVIQALSKAVGNVKVYLVNDTTARQLGMGTSLGMMFRSNQQTTFPAQRGPNYIAIRLAGVASNAALQPQVGGVRPSNAQFFAEVLVHEIAHAATVQALAHNPRLNLQVRQLLEAAWPHVEAKAKKLGWKPGRAADRLYGFTNTYEFVAEAFTNPAFQELLASIKLTPELSRELGIAKPKTETKPNLWQAFVNLVQQTLGINAKTAVATAPEEFSVLEGIMRVGSRVIDYQAKLPGDPARYIPYDKQKNATVAGVPYGAVPAPQPEFDGPRRQSGLLWDGHGGTPKPVAASAAFADKISLMYKYAAGISQLARRYNGFKPLVDYYGVVHAMDTYEKTLQDEGLIVRKAWDNLGTAEGDRLTAFLDDLTNMRYRSPQEVRRGVSRHPTQQELAAMYAQHKISPKGQRVADVIAAYFNNQLAHMTNVALEHAKATITDPVKLAAALTKIQSEVMALKTRPYFPFMRFGTHYVVVKDSKGRAVSMETFENSGPLGLNGAVRQQKKAHAYAQSQAAPGETVESGIITKEAEPYIGLPPTLLRAILTDPNLRLTQAQRDGIQQLLFAFSPQQSFRHRLQHKKFVQGYSMDFKRAFMRYSFSSSRYISRMKYVPTLNDLVEQAKNWRDPSGVNVLQHSIGQFMADHLENNILDQRADLGLIRGAAFIYTMGYVPAAATQNLTQTPLLTFPHLASKFGLFRAQKALLEAMTDLRQTYRRKGFYPKQTDFENVAMTYGIRSGRISEAVSPEIAALAQGGVLGLGRGMGPIAQRMLWISEKAAFMFEMAEQANRRIAWRAAVKLALANPNNKYVQNAIKFHEKEYNELINGDPQTNRRPMNPNEAAATVAAIEAVDRTQYVYSKYDRPKVFRGPIGASVFLFKKYLQSTLFAFAQADAKERVLMLMMMMLFGGLGGAPFAEDVRQIVKGVARAFGYRLDIEQEARKFLQQAVGEYADLILHGMSRVGYGIPQILDLMGSFATGQPGRGFDVGKEANVPFPIVDRSRAVTLSQALPIEIGKLIGGDKDVNATIADQTQKGVGAIWSVGFNMYKALMDSEHSASDLKRWERAMPRLFANLSRSFRYMTEERERFTRGGVEGAADFLDYDWRHNPEHAMEIIMQSMGYNTLRNSLKWDTVNQINDHVAFLEMRQKGLLGQLYEAIASDDDAEREKAVTKIEEFNEGLGDDERGFALRPRSIIESMHRRLEDQQKKSLGIPLQKRQAPIYESTQELYPQFPPGRTIEERRVPQ